MKNKLTQTLLTAKFALLILAVVVFLFVLRDLADFWIMATVMLGVVLVCLGFGLVFQTSIQIILVKIGFTTTAFALIPIITFSLLHSFFLQFEGVLRGKSLFYSLAVTFLIFSLSLIFVAPFMEGSLKKEKK